MKRHLALLVAAALVAVAAPALALAPTGAIFTTLEDGSEVNLNQFPEKEAVYLDGGPGLGAPQHAAGLDDGVYVFMVTDPPGKVLLSTDPAECRRFQVTDGIITEVIVTGGCEHQTGLDIDHGAVTVQLFPYDDTPNPGGVYKVWATREVDYPAECLESVDCTVAGTKHGFKPRNSKTDNFKIRGDNVRELDVQFILDKNRNFWHDGGDTVLAGKSMVWTDTNGVENLRYVDPYFPWGLYAHVEVPESDLGPHYLTIVDQKGCDVAHVDVNGVDTERDDQGRIAIDVAANIDYLVEVFCVRSGGGGGKRK